MTTSSRMRRLCDLRRSVEQNEASRLGSAEAALQRLDDALEQARIRKGRGRALVEESARTGETQDRVAGLEEIACAIRKYKALMLRKRYAQEEVQRIRERYLEKRTERCQAETLLRAALEREENAAQRRSQAALDEWHRMLRARPTRDGIEDGQSDTPGRT